MKISHSFDSDIWVFKHTMDQIQLRKANYKGNVVINNSFKLFHIDNKHLIDLKSIYEGLSLSSICEKILGKKLCKYE